MTKRPLLFLGIVFAIVIAFSVLRQPAVAPNGAITPMPEPTPTPLPANIVIEFPKPGAFVENPVRVTGKARVFEATFAYRVKDETGIIYEGFGMTTGPSVPDYGNFDFKVSLPAGTSRDVTIEVFEHSAKDGSIINLASVSVKLTTLETTKVKAFFSNNTLDPEVTCTKVFPLEREVIKTQEVGFASVFELLRGVLPDEGKNYYTSIPQQTILNSLIIRDGTAYADFNHVLEQGAGGSCLVQAIRSQIEATLKQFSTIKNVIISINGRTEDILQP